jgi:hypothetical protein
LQFGEYAWPFAYTSRTRGPFLRLRKNESVYKYKQTDKNIQTNGFKFTIIIYIGQQIDAEIHNISCVLHPEIHDIERKVEGLQGLENCLTGLDCSSLSVLGFQVRITKSTVAKIGKWNGM